MARSYERQETIDAHSHSLLGSKFYPQDMQSLPLEERVFLICYRDLKSMAKPQKTQMGYDGRRNRMTPCCRPGKSSLLGSGEFLSTGRQGRLSLEQRLLRFEESTLFGSSLVTLQPLIGSAGVLEPRASC